MRKFNNNIGKVSLKNIHVTLYMNIEIIIKTIFRMEKRKIMLKSKKTIVVFLKKYILRTISVNLHVIFYIPYYKSQSLSK